MERQPIDIGVTGTFEYTIEDLSALYGKVFDGQAMHNFFLSFEWISTWLLCTEKKPELITFSANSRTIGFVLVGVVKTVLGNVYYLNQTGNKEDDQIWIEYNDVICRQNHQECRIALLNYLSAKSFSWQFVGINLINNNWNAKGWEEWSSDDVNGYSVFLNNESYDSHFSKNTKSQISRSHNLIQKEYGEITVQWLGIKDLQDALKDIAEIHIKQWGEHNYGSGFSNKKFVQFHEKLLATGITQYTHIAKFTAGDLTLGYLYFFTSGDKVYFYLSAINYQNKNNKFKPGLVMHKLALAHFKTLGYSEYDFLAGQARYKTSLSNNSYALYGKKLYMKKWYYQPVKLLVKVKRWLLQLSTKQQH